jgi:quinol monooxygenase YgiN
VTKVATCGDRGDHEMPDDIEISMVTMRFDAREPASLLAILSKYIVTTRQATDCRNVDLVFSVTVPNRFLIVEKWASTTAQRAHFDSAEMVEMAQSCAGLLRAAPEVELWDAMSAHDLH